jgi:hypothetical protein
MSNLSSSRSFHHDGSQHAGFLALQPIVVRHAQVVFRRYPAVEQEELIAEAVAAAFVSYLALKARGREPHEFPSAIAKYSTLRVMEGRHVGSRSNCHDVLARRVQRRRWFQVRPLPPRDTIMEAAFVTDETPVLDQVVFRIDVPAFLQKLTERDQQIARALAEGHAAIGVARQFGVTPGRVTQLRQQWHREWLMFQDETPSAGSWARRGMAPV